MHDEKGNETYSKDQEIRTSHLARTHVEEDLKKTSLKLIALNAKKNEFKEFKGA